MSDYSARNKSAWEYCAYEFWCREAGNPADRAAKIKAAPERFLRKYAAYFDRYKDVRIANICGSCGKKAVPLALLGAEVTVFDISEDNRRYALQLAEAEDVPLNYQVCDILDIDLKKYGGKFDVVFMEGGILHYFPDIDSFMAIMNALLKPGGKMICSDFHPFTKIAGILGFPKPADGYFSTDIFEDEMPHAAFLDEKTRQQIPKCLYRKYTLSEILNAILQNGFTLIRFDEHPAWTDPQLPGEFTAVAVKQ